MNKESVVAATLKELEYATVMYPKFNSAHEGYSVLNEEVFELWEHVRAKQGYRNVNSMRSEAIQVAAMALRFAIDICCNEEAGQK